MTDRVANIAVLGSTGSIGRSTLEVIAASGGRLKAVALSAHRNTDLLLQQAQSVRPRKIVVTDLAAASQQDWSNLPKDVELLTGDEAAAQLASDPDVDIVVSAIVGSAGLRGIGMRHFGFWSHIARSFGKQGTPSRLHVAPTAMVYQCKMQGRRSPLENGLPLLH